MSYILTLKNRPEGVFSVVSDLTGEHVIPIFDDKDEAFTEYLMTEFQDAETTEE